MFDNLFSSKNNCMIWLFCWVCDYIVFVMFYLFWSMFWRKEMNYEISYYCFIVLTRTNKTITIWKLDLLTKCVNFTETGNIIVYSSHLASNTIWRTSILFTFSWAYILFLQRRFLTDSKLSFHLWALNTNWKSTYMFISS